MIVPIEALDSKKRARLGSCGVKTRGAPLLKGHVNRLSNISWSPALAGYVSRFLITRVEREAVASSSDCISHDVLRHRC